MAKWKNHRLFKKENGCFFPSLMLVFGSVQAQTLCKVWTVVVVVDVSVVVVVVLVDVVDVVVDWASGWSNMHFPSWWLNQPNWKICTSQIGSFPHVGVKIKKYLSCHHLVSFKSCLVIKENWAMATRPFFMAFSSKSGRCTMGSWFMAYSTIPIKLGSCSSPILGFA